MSAYKAIMNFRQRVPKRQREQVWATAEYTCSDCLIKIPVDVCKGVGGEWFVDAFYVMARPLPLPLIDCPACGQEKTLAPGALVPITGASATRPIAHGHWTVRVPSRRAAVTISRRGAPKAEAQVVKPEIDIWAN